MVSGEGGGGRRGTRAGQKGRCSGEPPRFPWPAEPRGVCSLPCRHPPTPPGPSLPAKEGLAAGGLSPRVFVLGGSAHRGSRQAFGEIVCHLWPGQECVPAAVSSPRPPSPPQTPASVLLESSQAAQAGSPEDHPREAGPPWEGPASEPDRDLTCSVRPMTPEGTLVTVCLR